MAPLRPSVLYPVVGVGALLVLALGQEALDARRVRTAPTAGASWIWAADAVIEDGPEVFYAARDWELAFEPGAASIEILADEEYWLSVNGASVGAGRWALGAPLDRYDLGGLLRRGGNRLVVELRSARGAGGLIALLTASAEGATEVLGTDGSWRIVRRHERALFAPDEAAPSGRPPKVWGPAPLGRWGMPGAGRLHPRLDALRLGRRPWRPQQACLAPDGPWQPAPGARSARPLGPWVVFDWGSEVVGYLSVGFLAGEEPAHGLLWTSSEASESRRGVDPRLDPYDAVILGAPGRTWWTDVRPRRLRYAYVLGLDQVTVAEIYPVRLDRAASLLDTPQRPAGLWGLPPPRLVTAIEHEIWRELQSLPGVGGRQVP